MSIWDDIEEGVSDAADAVGDVLSDVADAVGDAADWLGEAASDAADWTGGALVDAGEGMLEGGDAFLTALDDSGFFDVVEYGTVGMLDIDYDDSGFGLDFGIEDVFGYGIQLGEDGVGFDVDVAGMGVDVSYDGDGLGVSGRAGWDWGPLPYVEGHVSVDDHGNVGVGGEVHLYIPTPAGVAVGVEVEGDYQETDEGFRASGSLTGGSYAASGTYAKGGVHASYEEDADGYHTNVGLHGEVGQAGVGSIKGSVDYEEGRDGDVSYSGVRASGEVEGVGYEVGGSVAYEHVETPDGDYDVVSGDVHAAVGGQEVDAGGALIVGADGDVSVEGDLGFEADPAGVLGAAADVAGIGAEALPDVVGDLPGGLGEAADLAGDLGAAADELGDITGVPPAGGAVGNLVGDAVDDAVGGPATAVAEHLAAPTAPEPVADLAEDLAPPEVQSVADFADSLAAPIDLTPDDPGPDDPTDG